MKKRNSRYYFNFSNYTTIIVCIILLNVLLQGCGGNSDSSNGRNGGRLIPSVEAVQSRNGTLPLTERLTGAVKAKNQVEIYPEISAMVVEILVNNGDVVKKGQPLLRLRDKEFQERLKQATAEYQIARAQAKQAEARLNEIKSELKRTESLAEKGLASASQLETIQSQAISAEASMELANARVDQAKANLEENESQLSETIVRAPVSGTIGNRNAEIGMLVSTNARLFTLGQLDRVKIEVVLTDRMLNYIQAGLRSEIISDILTTGTVDAPLTRISPFLNPVTHTTIGEIELENPDESLKPGMFVSVDIYYGESEHATLIPLSALYENPNTGETGVYVSKDSLGLNREPISHNDSDKSMALTEPVPFTFIPVDVVARGRMEAGISGVEAGDWVITIGQNLIGGNTGTARVHKVDWNWVEQLQNLQSQDLLKSVMEKQQTADLDTLFKVAN